MVKRNLKAPKSLDVIYADPRRGRRISSFESSLGFSNIKRKGNNTRVNLVKKFERFIILYYGLLVLFAVIIVVGCTIGFFFQLVTVVRNLF